MKVDTPESNFNTRRPNVGVWKPPLISSPPSTFQLSISDSISSLFLLHIGVTHLALEGYGAVCVSFFCFLFFPVQFLLLFLGTSADIARRFSASVLFSSLVVVKEWMLLRYFMVCVGRLELVLEYCHVGFYVVGQWGFLKGT